MAEPSVKIEQKKMGALDVHGLPSYTRDEWLHDMKTIYPRDAAHATVKLPAHAIARELTYVVRISDLSVSNENIIGEYCKSELARFGESS